MGYGFAQRTLNKRVTDAEQQVETLRADMKERDEKCDERIEDITSRLREIEDRYMNGMERQLAQARESGLQLIDRGVIRPATPRQLEEPNG
jgi:Tfp pilus assembly protein PilO